MCIYLRSTLTFQYLCVCMIDSIVDNKTYRDIPFKLGAVAFQLVIRWTYVNRALTRSHVRKPVGISETPKALDHQIFQLACWGHSKVELSNGAGLSCTWLLLSPRNGFGEVFQSFDVSSESILSIPFSRWRDSPKSIEALCAETRRHKIFNFRFGKPYVRYDLNWAPSMWWSHRNGLHWTKPTAGITQKKIRKAAAKSSGKPWKTSNGSRIVPISSLPRFFPQFWL